jgi:hypothetical protein
MKKILNIILAATIAVVNVQAQTKVEKKLNANLATIDDVTKMLQADYIFITNTATDVPNNTFKMGDCMVLTSFADDGINKEAKDVEKLMNDNLSGSTWKFSGESKSEIATVKVTAKSKTDEGGFSTSGGMFNVTRIIEGLDIQAGLYQSKKNKNMYMIMFGIKQGMACFADFEKQKGGAAIGNISIPNTDAVKTVIPATDAVKPAMPKVDAVKEKAKSKLLNKIKL